jgi:DNA-binding HxlR family transcriptional regulator
MDRPCSPADLDPETFRSRCPVASVLDLVGDRWTLLVVRDLLLVGKHRFGEFLESPEGISTNILADRLARLERIGLVARRRYRERPPRDEYHPTAPALDLRPLLMEMIRWGNEHLPDTFRVPPEPDGSG